MASQQGTDGRVYGGDCNLIHVSDGKRGLMGQNLAAITDSLMRADARFTGTRTEAEADVQNLCPGCYMTVLFDQALTLAKRNDQSFAELGNTMGQAFTALAECDTAECIEEIRVVLDRMGDKA